MTDLKFFASGPRSKPLSNEEVEEIWYGELFHRITQDCLRNKVKKIERRRITRKGFRS